jgi:hypothetical protein
MTYGDTVRHVITNSKALEIFAELLSGKQEKQEVLTSGKLIGEVIYFSKNTILLKANIHDNVFFYTFKHKQYSSKLTYRAGMYFDEIH